MLLGSLIIIISGLLFIVSMWATFSGKVENELIGGVLITLGVVTFYGGVFLGLMITFKEITFA